ncbi:MAG: type II toxin-antitoxin system VapC family toxin [Chloroflexi bacterium]|nr:type II toxin-antitoxin system VapC family toxin [Chloroflexota bacterium]
MSYQICVDASLAILWLIPTQRTQQAAELLEQWVGAGVDLICPPLFDAEVTSTIRLHVYLKKILPEEGEEAFSGYSALGVRVVTPQGLSQMAWELAKRYHQPRTYDMQYLAVAELEDCDFWTLDRKLVNAVRGNKRIKWVGEYLKKI